MSQVVRLLQEHRMDQDSEWSSLVLSFRVSERPTDGNENGFIEPIEHPWWTLKYAMRCELWSMAHRGNTKRVLLGKCRSAIMVRGLCTELPGVGVEEIDSYYLIK